MSKGKVKVVVFRNRILAAAGTLLIAFVAGQVVQRGEKIVESAHRPAPAAVTPYNVGEVTPLSTVSQNVHLAKAEVAALPVLPVAPRAAQSPPVLPQQDDSLQRKLSVLDAAQESPEADLPALNAFGLPCETNLSARALADAMVQLTLQATCYAQQPVEFFQDRLRFTQLIPASGTLELTVPAMSVLPVFVAELSDGTVLTAPVSVPDTAQYERVALQWSGRDGFHLHAFEYGAKYGETGHIWAERPFDPVLGAGKQGGVMTALGDDLPLGGWTAEVYSFPQQRDTARGVVRLNIEAEITNHNCGRQIEAETLQSDADGQLISAQVTMSVPACDAVGEFLVLKNILRDLKIAQN